MGNPMEMGGMHRNLNLTEGGGSIKLTPEQMKNMVRNLDVTKIKDLGFKNAITDVAPEAKMLLGEKNNLKDGLLALSDTSKNLPPMKKEDFLKKWTENTVLLNELNDSEWEKIEKNGAVIFPTYLKKMNFVSNEKNPKTRMTTTTHHKQLSELFTEKPTVEFLSELSRKYTDKDPELMQKIADYEKETGYTLELDGDGAPTYVFALEKQMVTGNEAEDFKQQLNKERYPTLVFNYEGHTFEIIEDPFDNTQDPTLQSKDNPFFLKRFGAKFQLKIDGQEYKEQTFDPQDTARNNPSATYSGFNSWRKWIGYEDVVVKD